MAVIGAAISYVGGWLAGGSIMAGVVTNLLISTAVGAISSAIRRSKMRNQRQPGIKTDYTTEGGAQPQSFVLGWYATDGHYVCPPITHGKAGKSPNAFLTYVISLGNVPGQQLDKVIINDKEVEFGATDVEVPAGGTVPGGMSDWWYVQQGLDPNDPNAGLPSIGPGRPGLGKYDGKVWMRYYDGTQTSVDTYLLDIAGEGTDWAEATDRPWLADMVGIGTCYAIVTFKLDRELWSGLPRCRFVMHGIPLYDPRADSTVGGSGAQRWDNPATWAPSNNALVQAYNVLRGIPVEGGPIWGYGAEAEELPLGSWMPAMNTADLDVGGVARWRAGLEVSVEEEPADILDQIGLVSTTDFAEVGGIWKPRVGPPAAPVMFISDDDILINHDETFTPFPAIDDTYNGIHATYPNPKELWQPKDAPPRYNAEWEASDNARRRVAELTLSACPYAGQVQRVMRAYIEEERRFGRHVITLPAEASALEPLDSIALTWPEYGYVNKVFEVVDAVDDPDTLAVTVSLRERDPEDHNPPPGFELPESNAPSAGYEPAPMVPADFSAEGIALPDANGLPRRPAARLRWGGWALEGVNQVLWEIRLSGSSDPQRGVIGDPESGEKVVAAGILPAEDYEARILFMTAGDVAASWTAWVPFTTPDIRLGAIDVDGPGITQDVLTDISALEDWIVAEVEDLEVDYQAALDAAGQADAARAAAEGARDLALGHSQAAEAAKDLALQAVTDADAAAAAASGHASTAAARATDAGQHADAAAASAAQAETDAGLAAASAAQAATSESTADGHRLAAEVAMTASVQAKTDAEDAATAASGFASTAETKATEAGTAATAAAASATQAELDRVAGSTARDQAVAAKQDAETAAASALLREQAAVQAATDAGLSAAAAHDSEVLVSAMADAASQSAAAADTSRIAAETAKAGSEIARNDAVVARTGAEGAYAGAQSVFTQVSQIQQDVTEFVGNPDFRLGSAGWRGGWILGAGTEGFALGSNGNIGPNTLRLARDTDGSSFHFAGAVPVNPTRKYQLSAVFARTGSAPGDVPIEMRIGIMGWDAEGANYVYTSASIVESITAGGWISRVGPVVSGAAITAKLISPYIRLDTPGSGVQFDAIYLRDVTDSEAINARITNDYLTSAQTNQAIAAAETTLNASIGAIDAKAEDAMAVVVDLEGAVATRKILVQSGSAGAAGIEAVSIDRNGAVASSLVLHGDNVIAPGTLSTNALVVGLGRNLLIDPEWIDGMAHWVGPLSFHAAGSASGYANPAYPVAYMFSGAPGGGNQLITARPAQANGVAGFSSAPAAPGEVFIGSVYSNAYRCTGDIYLQFCDKSGTALSTTYGDSANQSFGSTIPQDGWKRIMVKATAPANTAMVRWGFRKNDTASGQADSYIFLWKPQLERAHASATQPAPWSPGGTTFINGGRLFAQSILTNHLGAGAVTAEKISVANLSAISANLGSIQVGNANIANLAVDRIKIADGSITGMQRLSGSRTTNTMTFSVSVAASASIVLGFTGKVREAPNSIPPDGDGTVTLAIDGTTVDQTSVGTAATPALRRVVMLGSTTVAAGTRTITVTVDAGATTGNTRVDGAFFALVAYK